MATKISTRAKAPEAYLQQLYLKTEQSLINEILRKRSQGYVDYAEVAALERVQETLQGMIDESFVYVPQMIEKRFYVGPGASRGYANAAGVATSSQRILMEQLVDNLLAEIVEAAGVAYQTSRQLYRLARLDDDELRQAALTSTAYTEALGRGAGYSAALMEATIRNHGVTAFVDRAGRHWSLTDYCNMATRTTAGQAEVAAVLSQDDHDLYQIVKIGSTCPLCAVYEGRVYSKSGTSPYYPPLALAFGKIDPAGGDDLSNTYLNIHPNCLVPGGFVFAEGVVSESRRFYSGEIVSLETTGGNKISVTPNHPILTDRGFVAAGELVEGDKIIETTGEYSRLFGETPDDVNIEAVLNEELHALMKSRSGASCRVKGSTEQFHGDGCADEEVDVIFTDGLRTGERDVVFPEELEEKRFPARKLGMLKLLSDSPLAQIIIRALFSTDSIVGGFRLVRGIEGIAVHRKKFANLREATATPLSNLHERKTFVVKPEELLKLFAVRLQEFLGDLVIRFFRFAVPFWRTDRPADSVVLQCMIDGPHVDVKLPGDFRETEPLAYERLKNIGSQGGLVVSVLVHKESSFYSGYVYNFETKRGYYVYNNIVTHNCLHSLIKYTEMGKTDKQIEKMREFSNPETNPLDIDPRSKKQIEAYREKERNRARLLRDIRQNEEMRAVLGSNITKDIQKFRDLKYNNPEKWEAKLREYKTVKSLKNKASWNPDFREKAVSTYYQFKKDGLELSSHAVGRFLDRSRGNYTVKDIVEQWKKPANYSQPDGRKVKFYNERAIVFDPDTREITTLINRKKPRGDWTSVI